MEEVVKKEREVRGELNREGTLDSEEVRMPRSFAASPSWWGWRGAAKAQSGQWCISQSAQCSGKWGTWNSVSSSTASSKLLRLPSQLPN